MPTPLTHESRALIQLLADQQWHSYDEVRDALARKVPPAKAFRKYRERLMKGRNQQNIVKDEITHTEDEQIYWGARLVAQVTISSWKNRGGLMWRGEGSEKEIRLRTGTKVMGIPVEQVQEPAEVQDPGFEGEGYTDLPPEDSEPVEASTPRAQEALPAEVVEPEPVQESPPVEQAPESEDDLSSLRVRLQDLSTCSECHMVVSDEAAHTGWHEDQKQALKAREMALIDEKGLQTLLGDVMGLGLDRFQQGMQDYLEREFAQLGRQIQGLRDQLTQQGKLSGSSAQGKSWRAQG